MLHTVYDTATGHVYRHTHVWQSGLVFAAGTLIFAVARPLLHAALRPPQSTLYFVAELFFSLLMWGWVALACLVIADLCGSLEIGPEGVTFQFLGCRATTPWSNVKRIDDGDTLFGNGTRLRLARPVTARPRPFVRNVNRPTGDRNSAAYIRS